MYYLASRACCGRAIGATALANGQYSIKFAAIDQDAADLPSAIADATSTTAGAAAIETKGQFSLS